MSCTHVYSQMHNFHYEHFSEVEEILFHSRLVWSTMPTMNKVTKITDNIFVWSFIVLITHCETIQEISFACTEKSSLWIILKYNKGSTDAVVQHRIGQSTDILVLVGIIVLTVRYTGNTVTTGIKIYIYCPV